MHTVDGRWVITFNGEIYNFQQLRRELEAAGGHLRTRTDTEVLIELIARRGISALAALDGMFAFAAFDTTTGELILARDPFGEKPLAIHYWTTARSRLHRSSRHWSAFRGLMPTPTRKRSQSC